MQCDIITLFPDMVHPVLAQSILKRAQEKGLLEVKVHNLRDYTQDRHRVVDDTPYGGGAGMVLKAEPVLRAIDALRDTCPQSTDAPMRILIPSPQGRPLTHQLAEELKMSHGVLSSFADITKDSTNAYEWASMRKRCPSAIMCSPMESCRRW